MKGYVPVGRCGLAGIGSRTNHQGVSGYYGWCLLGAERRDVCWFGLARMYWDILNAFCFVVGGDIGGRMGGGEGLDQMLCSCGSFSMMCQWSHIDLENFLPFDEYSITIGRTVLELDALGVLQRRVSREWRRALEMLRVRISKGYFLARRDTVRESSSFYSMVSSAMRRLYLRACEKTMLSLHVSEWLEWK